MRIYNDQTVVYVTLEDCSASVQKEHSQGLCTIHQIDHNDLKSDCKLKVRDAGIVILKIGKNVKLLKSRF